MLGIRLGADVEQRFLRFAQRRGRSKSEIARTAIVEYLDRHELDREFERQLETVARLEASDPGLRRELDEAEALAWRTADSL